MSAEGTHARYERVLGDLDAPLAFVDLDAMWANAADLLRRAGGTPIRVASKSVRCRALLRAMLDRDPGFRGLMTFTLPESLWLAGHGFDDLLLAYPTVDRGALRELAAGAGPRPGRHGRLRRSISTSCRPASRVCLDVDLSYWALGGRVRIGAKRSPVRTPAQAAALAARARARRALRWPA